MDDACNHANRKKNNAYPIYTVYTQYTYNEQTAGERTHTADRKNRGIYRRDEWRTEEHNGGGGGGGDGNDEDENVNVDVE